MTPARRAKWIIGLLLVHFFIVPCASAMILMPADADCGHCGVLDAPDPCLLNTTAGLAADGLLVDGGRADLPKAVPAQLLPASLAPASPAIAVVLSSRVLSATRHSGDPPPYLRLGQLRL